MISQIFYHLHTREREKDGQTDRQTDNRVDRQTETGNIFFRTLGIMKPRENKYKQSSNGIDYNISLAYAQKFKMWVLITRDIAKQFLYFLWKQINQHSQIFGIYQLIGINLRLGVLKCKI